jgi:GNAT superfamily N-acetyltransferase
MIVRSQTAQLRDGAQATATVVRAPDSTWAGRIEAMLGHKGDPWDWQNAEIARKDLGLEARFFLLQRGEAPFANIMLAETEGVGLLGHVWTEAADRGLGASSVLMELLLADFRDRGGRALFLGTVFDTAPWHYYRRRGFEPVESGSGYMALYQSTESDFYSGWFEVGSAEIKMLGWPDWPAAAPLFLGAFPGAVRISATQLIGRRSPEGPLLPLLREEEKRQSAGLPGCACILRAVGKAAVLGFASRFPDSTWPDLQRVDLYCHPKWWHRAGELLAALPAAEPGQSLAYADADLAPKCQALERAGFKAVAVLPRWIATDAARTTAIDVIVYLR